MAALDWNERFTGAYATPTLVGRTELLAQIDGYLQSPAQQPQIVILIGDGGIGKTRLLRTVLERAGAQGDVYAAPDVIDLYDIPTHSRNGLAEAIVSQLEVGYPGAFNRYEQIKRKLTREQQAGDLSKIAQLREELIQSFVSTIRSLSASRRVVLALDTAERLVYGGNQVPEPFPKVAEAWEWLCTAAPQLGNVVLLVAGRFAVEQLHPLLSGVAVHRIPVGPFSAQESSDYFTAVAAAAQRDGDSEVAQRVRDLPDSLRLLAHQLSVGRPIILALLVDHLSVNGNLPGLLETSNHVTSVEQREQMSRQLKVELIGRLIDTPRIGTTIVALGRVPKGADMTLLSALLGTSPQEAQECYEAIHKLSFVKIRNKRVFLHDEMYSMLSEHVYDSPADDISKVVTGKVIREYYERQLNAVRSELTALFKPIEDTDGEHLNKDMLAETIAHQQALEIEYVSYLLRQDAVLGFQQCFRFGYNAIVAGATVQDLLLQAELLAFLSDRDPSGAQHMIGSIERDLIVGYVALRSVVRAWAEQKYHETLALVAQIRRDGSSLIAADAPTTAAALSIWEASALTNLGGIAQYETARARLDEAIKTLLPLRNDRTISEARRWRAQAELAMAYNCRGYLQRMLGDLHEAAADYGQSIVLWRRVDVQVELAATLTNMSFAIAELGQWSDAKALIKEALDIRRRSGSPTAVGTSLTTLSMTDIREGNYERAIRDAEQALRLLRALENDRGIGLALLSLAAAERYSIATADELPIDRQVDRLREVIQHAEEALEIFTRIGETARQLEAQVEIGCAYRDWALIRRRHPSAREHADRLIEQSRMALLRAADIAGESIIYRRLDALVNLAWLGLYADREDLVTEYTHLAEEAMPKEYRLTRETGRPTLPHGEAQIQLWKQFGKLHMLKGHWAMQRRAAQRLEDSAARRELLIDAITEYTVALEYNSLYARDYPGIRHAKQQIFDRLKALRSDELSLVTSLVRDIEGQYHLEASMMQQLLRNLALWEEV